MYLHRGTLQGPGWSQMDECRRRSCHILLQLEQPPRTLFSQVAKWRIRSWRLLHVENLLQGPLFLLGSWSHGPTLVHPSVHMCCRHSIASLSCRYRLWSFRFRILRFSLCSIKHNIIIFYNKFLRFKKSCLLWKVLEVMIYIFHQIVLYFVVAYLSL